MKSRLNQQERNLLVFFILNAHLRVSILEAAESDPKTSESLREAYLWALEI